MSTDTLKPCPWCGGRALAYDVRETHGICTVECTGCNAERSGDTPELAAAAWNRRAGPALDVEKVMVLADAYAQAVSTAETSTHECWRSIDYRNKRIAEQHAAREALRSALMSNAAPEVDRSSQRVEVVQADELDARYGFVTKVARGLALEEAAKLCDDGWHLLTRHECAAAIRALADPLQGKETQR